MKKTDLQFQKLHLKSALNAITLIEVCEEQIVSGIKVDYWKIKKTELIEQYANDITKLFEYLASQMALPDNIINKALIAA